MSSLTQLRNNINCTGRHALVNKILSEDEEMDDNYHFIEDEFETYEDYLDSQIAAKDIYFLEDVEVVRQLVELGLRGNGEVIRREEFDKRKAAAEAARRERLDKKPKRLASQGKDLSGKPLLQELQKREEAVRNGKLATIVFIRDYNSLGQEISGYIDYGHRLKSGNMEAVFDGKVRFLPKPTDLSFYNWDSHASSSNPTPNFQVIADNAAGLVFKNKRDRKVICVDPSANPGDNSTRADFMTDEYMQVVIYDHVTRRRA